MTTARTARPWRTRAAPARLVCPVLLAVAVAACSAPVETFDLLPDLELARTIVASDQIFPGHRSGDPELSVGWSGGDGDTLRIPEGSADIDLKVALPGDHALRVEVLSPGEGALMTASLGFGGRPEPLESLPLPPGWNTVEIALPAGRLRHGANRLRLDFESIETVAGAAGAEAAVAGSEPVLVRGLRLLGPDGRAPWPDRPGDVPEPATPAASEAPAAEIAAPLRTPTGSSVDLYVRLPASAGLRTVARLERPAGQARAPVYLRVEALGPGGALLAETAAELAGDDGTVELEMAELAGEQALLRWTASGPGNAVVVWETVELRGIARAAGSGTVGGAPADPTGKPSGPLGNDSDSSPAFDPVPRRARALLPPDAGGLLGRRDVVVVLLDAARRDAVGVHGGTVPTPRIDGLAGTRIDGVMAAAPWTAPSVATMMTGLYPDAHGLQGWDAGVPKSVRSLGESFAAAGYRTVLFSQHPIWGAIPTLRRGFAVQEFVPETERGRLPGLELLFGGGPGPDSPDDAAVAGPDAPTFAVVHLLLPHDPYEPPAPFRGRYTGETQGNAGRFAVDSGALHDFRLGRGRRAPVPSPERVEYARARYDETVAWTDAVVGELIDRIDGAGRDPEPLVILLSDHGEAFYEHGWFLHTRNLYEEMAAIPWLIRWPGDITGHVPVLGAGPISTVDLMPTLLDLMALPYDGPGMHGRSLVPWLLGRADAGTSGPGAAYAVTTRVETGTAPPLLAWRDGRYKAVWDTLWHRLELYDLVADPREQEDLAASRPLLAQRLLQELMAQRLANLRVLSAWRDAGQNTELDEESIRRLRALGYLR